MTNFPPKSRVYLGFVVLGAWAAVLALLVRDSRCEEEPVAAKLDPAAWGTDHVGKEQPEYMTGGECLFCHRPTGRTWHQNRHHRTIRELEARNPRDNEILTALADWQLKQPTAKEMTVVVGSGNHARLLKPTDKQGDFAILPALFHHSAKDSPPHFSGDPKSTWDLAKFGNQCAGCHASGTDSASKSFLTAGHDCFVCHGVVEEEHANDIEMVLFSRKRKDPKQVEISVCASCHVRTGKSQSTGLPYPNNFVAGDNLFRDFKVDLSDDALKTLDPGDRHVLESIREVTINGREDLSCLSCHSVHEQSTEKHRKVVNGKWCQTCHERKKPFKTPIVYTNHSKLCEY